MKSARIRPDKLTFFYCADCDAKIPASSRKLRARKRRHQAVHDHFAQQQSDEREGALA